MAGLDKFEQFEQL